MPTAKKTAKTAQTKPAPATGFPTFTLTATQPKDMIADALIVNTTPGKGKSVELVAHGFTPAQAKRIATEIEHLGGTGKNGEVIKFASGDGIKAPVLVAVGLGDFRKNFDLEQFRRAIGNGVRALSGTKKVAISGGHSPEHVDATVRLAVEVQGRAAREQKRGEDGGLHRSTFVTSTCGSAFALTARAIGSEVDCRSIMALMAWMLPSIP